MEESLRTLEAQVKELQDEIAFSRVKIGVQTFTSRAQTKAWMDMNHCPKRSALFFLDAMGLLALMHGGSMSSTKSAVEFASVTKKVGYTSTDEALVVTSFTLELPEAFGSLPDLGVVRDSRLLPALPTFKEWDGGDSYHGLKIMLMEKLGDFIEHMSQHYWTCLTGEALIVAIEMLTASKNFLFELFTWMNHKYTDTIAHTTATEKEAWALMAHCVQVIFKLLRDAQSSGTRWTLEDPNGDIQLIWAQLQSHKVMNELKIVGFGAHPALGHAWNLHLQDNMASRTKMEALLKRAMEAERLAREAKKLAPEKKGGVNRQAGAAAGAN
jgi:hypothetical protein